MREWAAQLQIFLAPKEEESLDQSHGALAQTQRPIVVEREGEIYSI